MKVTILDDYLDTLRTLACFERARRPRRHRLDRPHRRPRRARGAAPDTEALVLIRERTKIPATLLERLPRLRLISQRSAYPHIDIDACTRLGIIVSSDMHQGSPSYATAELTWALVLAATRQIPQQVAALKRGEWQVDIGRSVFGQDARGSTATGASAQSSPDTARRSG